MKTKFTPSTEFTSPFVKRFAHALLTMILYVSPLMVAAQLQLLKDVDQSENLRINEYSSLTSAGKYMYYISNGELWKSNGTTKYTVRMKPFRSISNLTMSGSTLYFTADDGQSGVELWKSNGAPGNTVRVKDIVPGAEGSSPAHLTDVDGTLFFSAYSKGKGTELWKSDGTAEGTVMVKDISRGSSHPRHLVNYNGILFFAATSPTGFELWRSDGTPDNTTLVKDMIAGPQSSYPSMLTVSNDKLYFVALHADAGRELWISDGTSAGTQLLKDIRPGSRTSGPENLIHANDKLMFSANDGIHGDELWASDGTPNGTGLVKDLNPGPAGSNAPSQRSALGHFTNINGILYFMASKIDQEYIYRSDGTAEGTMAITTAFGVNGSAADPEFTYRNGYVYFFNSQTNPDHIYGLYKMPYTGKIITRVVDLQVDAEYYVASNHEMIFLNGALFFPGRLIDNYQASGGYQLIRSDGTFEGTFSIHDTLIPTVSSNPREMISVGGRVYSLHYPNRAPTPYLYSTDGTPEGTFEIRAQRLQQDWEAVGNDLYFSELLLVYGDEGNAYRWQLSKTGGTPSTTHVVSVGEPWDVDQKIPQGLTNVDGTLYYFNSTGEVWKTNGAPAGTVMLADLFKVYTIVNVQGQAFVLASNESNEVEVWRSTMHGLTHVQTLHGSFTFQPPHAPMAISIGNVLYFVAIEADRFQIWRSDGTSAGTYRMFGPHGDPIKPYMFVPATVLIKYNEELYFSDGSALLKASEDGNTKIADMPRIRNYVEHNGKLFLFTYWPLMEVYVSDGTPEGTRLLHSRGIRIIDPFNIDYALVGDYVYFNANGEAQLWRTDGTECGTTQVNVGATGPYALESLGGNLIFGGYRTETGQELYVYHNVNSIPGPACEEEMFVAAHDAEANQEEMLTAYPNPFADSFTLNVAKSAGERLSVAVYTPGGMPVEHVDDIAAETHPLRLGAGWKKGHYIIKVRTAERVDTYHVVKE